MVYVKMVNISDTVKFRKQASGLFEGLIFGGAKLSMEGNFKVDWASLIVGGKFTCFCFVLLCI